MTAAIPFDRQQSAPRNSRCGFSVRLFGAVVARFAHRWLGGFWSLSRRSKAIEEKPRGLIVAVAAGSTESLQGWIAIEQAGLWPEICSTRISRREGELGGGISAKICSKARDFRAAEALQT